jgi:site-specific DNA-methyltransferase (adenine-specific)
MNKIYNDDCFNIFSTLEQNSINLVLVDLPYGQTNCDWDIKIDLQEMWKQLKLICKDNCQFIFFTTTKFGNELINSNYKWFRYDLVWEKSTRVGFFNANKMPLRNHEMMYIFSNPIKKKNSSKKVYNPQKTQGKPYFKKASCNIIDNIYGKHHPSGKDYNSSERYPISIINIKNPNNNSIHKTQKPIELCEWLIKTYSNENDLILDFCMGSVSTIVACINTKRNYIGIEKNNDIFKTAEKRIDILLN